MTRLSMFPFVPVLVGAVIASCGDGGSADDDAADTSTAASTGKGASASAATTTTGANASSSSGTGEVCEPPDGTPSAQKLVDLTSVTGLVIDTAGMPVANHLAQLCGKDLCLNGTTGATGAVTITNTGKRDRPVFKAGDGLTYSRSGYEINADMQMVAASVVKLSDSGAQFVGGATLTAGSASLQLEPLGIAGFLIEFATPDEQTFRAGEIPVSEFAKFAIGQTFVAMWGLGPIETALCPPAKLTVPNTNDIAAGTALDVYYQELGIIESYGTYGTWNKIGEAVVSADKATIATTDGHHLPILGLIGFKAK